MCQVKINYVEMMLSQTQVKKKEEENEKAPFKSKK